MENLEKLNVVELNDDELVQINGGNLWNWFKLIYRAFQVQEFINNFRDGWNSVDCGCPNQPAMKN
jgi:hypothetical protein